MDPTAWINTTNISKIQTPPINVVAIPESFGPIPQHCFADEFLNIYASKSKSDNGTHLFKWYSFSDEFLEYVRSLWRKKIEDKYPNSKVWEEWLQVWSQRIAHCAAVLRMGVIGVSRPRRPPVRLVRQLLQQNIYVVFRPAPRAISVHTDLKHQITIERHHTELCSE